MPSLFATPTLQVTLAQEQIFVHPNSDSDSPTEDPSLRGTLVLTLPKRRAVKELKVVLIGLCDVTGGENHPYESSETLRKELLVDLEGEVLEAGSYYWSFSLIIPSSTAVYQRSQFGRVRHYVKGYATFDSTLSKSIQSSPIGFYVVANPVASGEPQLPTEVRIETFRDDLGPIGLSVSSPHLTVASLIHFKLTLAAPVEAATILSVSASISQRFEIHYDALKRGVAQPPPRRHIIFHVDSTTATSPDLLDPHNFLIGNALPRKVAADPLVQLEAGGPGWNYERIARLPCDDLIRPTTLDATETKIRVSHSIVGEIRYRIGSGPDQVLVMSKKVTIASCCCLLDSLMLPSYSREDEGPVLRPTDSKCLCNHSLEQMMSRDGRDLERAGTIEATHLSSLDGRGFRTKEIC